MSVAPVGVLVDGEPRWVTPKRGLRAGQQLTAEEYRAALTRDSRVSVGRDPGGLWFVLFYYAGIAAAGVALWQLGVFG